MRFIQGQMDAMLEEFEKFANELKFEAPKDKIDFQCHRRIFYRGSRWSLLEPPFMFVRA